MRVLRAVAGADLPEEFLNPLSRISKRHASVWASKRVGISFRSDFDCFSSANAFWEGGLRGNAAHAVPILNRMLKPDAYRMPAGCLCCDQFVNNVLPNTGYPAIVVTRRLIRRIRRTVRAKVTLIH